MIPADVSEANIETFKIVESEDVAMVVTGVIANSKRLRSYLLKHNYEMGQLQQQQNNKNVKLLPEEICLFGAWEDLINGTLGVKTEPIKVELTGPFSTLSPVDVFKGVCEITKTMKCEVIQDSASLTKAVEFFIVESTSTTPERVTVTISQEYAIFQLEYQLLARFDKKNHFYELQTVKIV